MNKYISKQPVYKRFGVSQFSDSKGREYRIADESFRSSIKWTKSPFIPSMSNDISIAWDDQVVYIKLPIYLRKTVQMPGINEKIDFICTKSLMLGTFSVKEIYYTQNRMTAWAITKDFNITSESTDPTQFPLFDHKFNGPRIKHRKNLLE